MFCAPRPVGFRKLPLSRCVAFGKRARSSPVSTSRSLSSTATQLGSRKSCGGRVREVVAGLNLVPELNQPVLGLTASPWQEVVTRVAADHMPALVVRLLSCINLSPSFVCSVTSPPLNKNKNLQVDDEQTLWLGPSRCQPLKPQFSTQELAFQCGSCKKHNLNTPSRL